MLDAAKNDFPLKIFLTFIAMVLISISILAIQNWALIQTEKIKIAVEHGIDVECDYSTLNHTNQDSELVKKQSDACQGINELDVAYVLTIVRGLFLVMTSFFLLVAVALWYFIGYNSRAEFKSKKGTHDLFGSVLLILLGILVMGIVRWFLSEALTFSPRKTFFMALSEKFMLVDLLSLIFLAMIVICAFMLGWERMKRIEK